ncbi:hypothetical protein P2318_16650 [Myxococcaceae bacterium GXIMD 01537]
METIVPGRSQISDRFPVASFTVAVPEDRYFEIACATDPRLFHRDLSRQRTSRNFFSTRAAGLMRAPRGQTTYLVPPEQLQRFAGAQRIYYALATYGNPRGEQARFSISPQTLERAPSILLSADFTGRTLDRSRIGRPAIDPNRYGGQEVPLSWGGDDALAAARPTYAGAQEYDDGFDSALWKQPAPSSGAPSPRAPQPPQHPGAPPPGRRRRGYRGAAFSSDDYDDADDVDTDDGMPYGDGLSAEGLDSEEDFECYDGEDLVETGTSAAAAADSEEEYEDAVELESRGGSSDSLRRVDTPSQGAGFGARHAPVPLTRFGAPETAVDEEYEDGATLAGSGAPVNVVEAAGHALSDSAAEPVASGGRDAAYSEEEVEEVLPEAAQALQDASTAAPAQLGIPEKFAIVEIVARAESGGARYAAINADTEYNDPNHEAYHRYHIGLSWGLVQFTQRGGALGRVLTACQRRDPAEFTRVFGADGTELLRVTTANTPEARVAPVAGRNLWEEPWLTRFRQAGAVGRFQAAQNEVAITDYLDVNLTLAGWLGFNTDRALAMLYDRCVHMGNGGGTSWVVRHAGPVRTRGELNACLRALGFNDVRSFQGSVSGLGADGKWGPRTHAAMTHALRALGSASPVRVAPLPEMLDRLVTAAVGTRFHRRVSTLRTTPDLHDTVYQVP